MQGGAPTAMKVAELKQELHNLGVTDLTHCLYKDDLVRELVKARQGRDTAAAVVPVAQYEESLHFNGRTYGNVIAVGNSRDPTSIMVFLHGLGDAAEGWAAEFQNFTAVFPFMLFIFPTASVLPLMLNMTLQVPSWYAMSTLGLDNPDDLPDMQQSAAYIDSVVARFANRYNIAQSRVLYAGFSQGACVALLSGLTTSRGPPAGIVSLSGYLGSRPWVTSNAKHRVPVFMAHGTQDSMLSCELCRATRQTLQHECGIREIFDRHYDMGHATCLEEYEDLMQWLLRHMRPTRG